MVGDHDQIKITDDFDGFDDIRRFLIKVKFLIKMVFKSTEIWAQRCKAKDVKSWIYKWKFRAVVYINNAI